MIHSRFYIRSCYTRFGIRNIRNLHPEVSLLNSHRLAGLDDFRNILHNNEHQEKPYRRKHTPVYNTDRWTQ